MPPLQGSTNSPHSLSLNPTWSSTRSRLVAGNTRWMLPQPILSPRLDSGKRSMRWRSCRSLPWDNFYCTILSIFLILFFTFLSVAWVTVIRDARLMNSPVLLQAPVVLILGDGLRLDPDAQSIFVMWRVIACDAPTTSQVKIPLDVHIIDKCKPFRSAFDIYLNDPSKPVFSYIPREPIGEAPDFRDQFSFAMEHRIQKDSQWDPVRQLSIPFNHYVFHAFAFAIDPSTNQSLHITTFTATSALGDFTLYPHDKPSANKFIYDSGNGLATTEVESRLLHAEIQLSTITMTFAVFLSLVNWSTAVGSIYITILVARGKLEAGSILVTLPFSAAITIPTIRSLYITSPPFGTSIDTVAFFVQLFTVSLCFLVLIKVLTRD